MDAIDQAKRANAVDTARLKAKLAYYKRVTDEIEQQRISDMHTLRFLSNQLTDLNQQLASKQARISAHSSRRNSRVRVLVVHFEVHVSCSLIASKVHDTMYFRVWTVHFEVHISCLPPCLFHNTLIHMQH